MTKQEGCFPPEMVCGFLWVCFWGFGGVSWDEVSTLVFVGGVSLGLTAILHAFQDPTAKHGSFTRSITLYTLLGNGGCWLFDKIC